MSLVAPATASAETPVKMIEIHERLLASDSIIEEVSAAESEEQYELLCMALNLYHEARGEDNRHQWAVIFVTFNRVEHSYYPDTYCEVVWEKSQFSWTRNAIGAIIPREPEAWKESQRKAFQVFTGEMMNDPTNGATHFYQAHINPRWAARLVDKRRIGVHEFARLPD